MDLPGYRLKKEADYYYVVLNRSQVDAYHQHQTTLAHVQPLQSPLKCFGRESINPHDQALLSLMLISRGKHRPDFPYSQTAPGDLQPAATNQAQQESSDTTGHDNSVKVIPNDDVTERTDNQENQDCFKADDNKISVIRPSSVKQVVYFIDKEKEDTTSVSSMQVIDDKEDADGEHKNTEQGEEHNKVPLKRIPATTDLLKWKPDSRSTFEKYQDVHIIESHISLPETQVADSEVNHTLSPLTLQSTEAESRKNLRRVQSSTSFEKYKQGRKSKSGKDHINCAPLGSSGHNSPQRRPSGPQTPSRSRQQSGLETPASSCLFDTSSRSSMGEEGIFDIVIL